MKETEDALNGTPIAPIDRNNLGLPRTINSIRISSVKDTYFVDLIISKLEYQNLFYIKNGDIFIKKFFGTKKIGKENIEYLYLESASFPVNITNRQYASLIMYKDLKTNKLKKLLLRTEIDSKRNDKNYDMVYKKGNVELVAILSSILEKKAKHKPDMMNYLESII